MREPVVQIARPEPVEIKGHVPVAGAVHGAGYRYVTLDLDGFRTGNLNHAHAGPTPVTAAGGQP